MHYNIKTISDQGSGPKERGRGGYRGGRGHQNNSHSHNSHNSNSRGRKFKGGPALQKKNKK